MRLIMLKISRFNMINHSISASNANFFATGFTFKFLYIHVKNRAFEFSWYEEIGVLTNLECFTSLWGHQLNSLSLFVNSYNGSYNFIVIGLVGIVRMLSFTFSAITICKGCSC